VNIQDSSAAERLGNAPWSPGQRALYSMVLAAESARWDPVRRHESGGWKIRS
jgi:hypothetical protein